MKALTAFSLVVLAAGVARAEEVGKPACVSDAGWARAYDEVRASWVRQGGISTGSISSDAHVRIQAAAVLARRAPELAAQARLLREGAARLKAWAAVELDPKSELAFYVRYAAEGTEKDAAAAAWLARAIDDSALRAKIAEGTRLLGAFRRAHAELENVDGTARDLRWERVPYEERKPLVEVGEAIRDALTLEGRRAFDDLALEFESDGGHTAFLPRLTWYGAGVRQGQPCPGATDGLLATLTSQGLRAVYTAMLGGRPLSDVARFSRRVQAIVPNLQEVSCMRRLPAPRARFEPATSRVQIDSFTRPASCGAHLVQKLGLNRRGEPLEWSDPSAEQLRREADRILAP